MNPNLRAFKDNKYHCCEIKLVTYFMSLISTYKPMITRKVHKERMDLLQVTKMSRIIVSFCARFPFDMDQMFINCANWALKKV